MKKVTLKKLVLHNFKNAEHLEINFDEKLTEIFGENRAGKTTIVDAYTWLLFGKDSDNSADFNVKRLDSRNNIIHHLDHEVEGTFIVDGEEIILRRILRENWTKKRGSEITELTGNDTTYKINDVPRKAGEYKAQIELIINEELSKMITNPLFFNKVMKWEERRKILSLMAGQITNEDILPEIQGDKTELIQLLNEGKNLVDEKKRLAANRKRIKDELDLIPPRLDEVVRDLPEVKNWDEIESEIDSKKKLIEEIEERIENKSLSQKQLQDEISEKQTEKFKLERELTALKNESLISSNREVNEIKVQINALENQKTSKESELETLQCLIEETKKEIVSLKEIKDGLSRQWDEVNAEVFKMDSEKSYCPSCARPLDNALELEVELRDNFMRSIKNKKEEINEKGVSCAEKITLAETKLKKLETDSIDVKASIIDIYLDLNELLKTDLNEKTDVEFSKEMIDLSDKIAFFKIPELIPVDTSDLKEEKRIIQERIQELTTELSGKLLIEKAKERQEELKSSQRSMASEIAGIESVEMQIELYHKAEMEAVESRVNSKFKVVKFKLYESQINGGESPTCVCMINGVPYKDLNTGDKLLAGLDIINALQNHFKVFSPVFIDNKESLTHRVNVDSQLIMLSAMVGQKVLKIVS